MNGLLKVICLVAVISLSPAVFWSGSAQAAMPTVQQLEMIGPDLPLIGAGAIDLDGSSNLYIADNYHGVVKYSAMGTWVATFNAQPVGGSGLAVTPAGDKIYVAGSSVGSNEPYRRDQVAILDGTTGEFIAYLGQGAGEFMDAGEIDLDSNGRVYVLDAGAIEVKTYLANGIVDGVPFTVSDGTANSMSGLAVDVARNEILVADKQNPSQIRVYSTAGTLMRSYACASQMGAAVLDPFGMTVDATGRTYFVDKLGVKLNVLDTDGSVPANNTIDVPINSPTDVAADSYGRLYVSNGSRIVVFGLDNYTLPSNSAPTIPTALSPQGGDVADATPILSFSPSTDQDNDTLTYTISVSCNGSLVEGPVEQAGTTYQVVTPLPENGSCQWTVSAFDGAVSSAVASSTFAVNVLPEAPSAPSNLLPAAPAEVNGTTVLQWDAAIDPDPNDVLAYTIQFVEIDGPPVGGPVAAQSGVLLNQLAVYADMIPGRDYSWQVVASDGALETASAAQSFTFAEAGLVIDSNVPGADVYLGGNPGYFGQKVGQTPYVQLGAAAGDYQVAVAHKGFEPVFGMVTVGTGLTAKFDAAFAPALDPVGHFVRFEGLQAKMYGRNKDVVLLHTTPRPFLVDIDNDGNLDLVTNKEGAANLVVYPGMRLDFKSDLRFDTREVLAFLPESKISPFIVDWNNDGMQDLVYGAADGMVRLIANSGVPGVPVFDAGNAVILVDGNAPIDAGKRSAPVVADWNGDGAKDLIVGGADGKVSLYLNQNNDAQPVLAFAATLLQLVAPRQAAPVVVDWDEDGDLDLLVGQWGKIKFYSNVDGQLINGGLVTVLDEARLNNADLQGDIGLFVMDVDDRLGKDLLVSDASGQIRLVKSRGTEIVATFFDVLVQKLDLIANLVANDSNDPALLAMVADAQASATPAGLDLLPAKVAGIKSADGLPADATVTCDELLTILQ